MAIKLLLLYRIDFKGNYFKAIPITGKSPANDSRGFVLQNKNLTIQIYKNCSPLQNFL